MNEKKQDGITQALETVGTACLKIGESLWKSLRESFYGYMNGVMPFHRLAFASMTLSTFWLFQLDVTLLRLIHSSVPKFHMSPPVGIFRIILWVMSIAFPFLVWGWKRKNTIEALLKYLQDAFMAAGLQSNGKYPSLIREYITASTATI